MKTYKYFIACNFREDNFNYTSLSVHVPRVFFSSILSLALNHFEGDLIETEENFIANLITELHSGKKLIFGDLIFSAKCSKQGDDAIISSSLVLNLN